MKLTFLSSQSPTMEATASAPIICMPWMGTMPLLADAFVCLPIRVAHKMQNAKRPGLALKATPTSTTGEMTGLLLNWWTSSSARLDPHYRLLSNRGALTTMSLMFLLIVNATTMQIMTMMAFQIAVMNVPTIHSKQNLVFVDVESPKYSQTQTMMACLTASTNVRMIQRRQYQVNVVADSRKPTRIRMGSQIAMTNVPMIRTKLILEFAGVELQTLIPMGMVHLIVWMNVPMIHSKPSPVNVAAVW
mmetsp:Transcript_7182/g.15000  ORF Transcript_7182/g.15000 Transcript_7182/m.15000 type:complete len:246 (-) Transcript_7182:766-1503(-)